MAKIHRPGPQQSGSEPTSKNEKQQAPSSPPPQPKGKPISTRRKSTIGGTAVHGAKSTIPKEVPTGANAQQKAEYYNRETRRRMQQMGTGPYNEKAPVADAREQRKKRLQARQDKIKRLADAKGPSRDIKIGRRNTYFLLGIAVLIVIAIIVAIILHPFK